MGEINNGVGEVPEKSETTAGLELPVNIVGTDGDKNESRKDTPKNEKLVDIEKKLIITDLRN